MAALGRRGLTLALGVAAIALIACSPEASRKRGGGLGADVANTRLPIELRGNVQRNNPSFGVPEVGRAPDDATGPRAWWADE